MCRQFDFLTSLKLGIGCDTVQAGLRHSRPDYAQQQSWRIVSPLRARIFVRPAAAVSGSVPAFLALTQRVSFTLLFGTTSLVVDFRSTPPFIACNCATLTPVRFATSASLHLEPPEITRAVSRRSPGMRFSKATNCLIDPPEHARYKLHHAVSCRASIPDSNCECDRHSCRSHQQSTEDW